MTDNNNAPLTARDLVPLVYDELERIARRLHRSHRTHSVRPSSILQEAWAKLDRPQSAWPDRGAFLAVAASAMRQVLVDRARRRDAQKRGGGLRRVSLHDVGIAGDVGPLEVDEVLNELEEVSPRAARVVELLVFGGMTHEEVGATLGVSPRTAKREWRVARAWLGARLNLHDE